MRGVLASLVVAIVFMIIALLGSAIGAVGVALVGSLLHRWFDLTQWQGTLVALGISTGLGLVIYRMASVPTKPAPWYDNWEDDEDEEDEDEEEEDAPPIVPWRRSRPTQGELPSAKPTGGANKPTSTTKQRK